MEACVPLVASKIMIHRILLIFKLWVQGWSNLTKLLGRMKHDELLFILISAVEKKLQGIILNFLKKNI